MTTHDRALVTGASGFVGSRLVRHLVERGERVKAFVRAGSNLEALRDLPTNQVEVVYGDVTVGHTVFRALTGCNRLYHVAALYKFWDTRPERILDAAVRGTDEVLTAAEQRGLRKVVVTSTLGTVGANSAPEPLTEKSELKLKDPETYVFAKMRAEKLALDRARGGQPIVVVNPGSIFGPGDWKPTPTGRLVLEFLQRRVVFAPSTGGLSIVDVDDVAAGHRLAMEKGRVGERYILGGENVRHKQLFELLTDLTGHEPLVSTVGSGSAKLSGRLLELHARLRGGEPLFTYRMARDHAFTYLWASNEKAKRELGYSHRSAREALLRSVRWYLEHGYVAERAARNLQLVRA